MEFLPLLKSVWTVWFCALFVAILFWAFRPGGRAQMDRNARIPLDDSRPDPRTGV
jgi:cbb3-type cytochrome oxidase subunit 3